MDFTKIVLGLIAGLALFLYGLNVLSDGLRQGAGDKTRELLTRWTSNRFSGVAAGTLATTILDSSSVTIILVISLVNSALLSFEHSLAIIMGSNIGTTISSQLFAFNIDRYSPVILATGLLAHTLGRGERFKQIGLILFGFGLVFFGLHSVGEAMEPLKEHKPFLEWLRQAKNPIYGALIGALFTVLIQSSSATLGVIITMAGQGMLELPAGIAIMLGAEVGTCSDTLIATIGRSRAALRAGLFHLFFNLATVTVGLILAGQLAGLAKLLPGGGDVGRQIANAHVLFNILGVLLFLPFTRQAAALLKRMVPERAQEAKA